MRDFPMFTTENGVAGLTLKEIPYRQEAYIHLRATCAPQALLDECIDFCRVCGAERIYACGNEILESYPLHTAVLEMRGTPDVDMTLVENLFPVTEQTVGSWREIYNQRMRGIDNAATLESRDEKSLLSSGGAYFVHRDGKLLGIGWIEGEKLLCIASTESGLGKRVMHTLLSGFSGETLVLEVASTNERAIHFYESLGFVKTREINRWFRVK